MYITSYGTPLRGHVGSTSTLMSVGPGDRVLTWLGEVVMHSLDGVLREDLQVHDAGSEV